MAPRGFLLSLFIFALVCCLTSGQTYKVCVTLPYKHFCSGLKRGDSPLECDQVADPSDCAQRISAGLADFGVFNAEAVAVAAPFEDNSLRAIVQLRHVERFREEHAFQSVVVIRNSFEGTLHRARFCHPGFSDSRAWTDRVLKKVERSSMYGTMRECDPTRSGVENEISSIANYFASSCRPGDWAPDPAFDRKLKKTYHSLCDLCDNPSKCAYDNQAYGSHEAALQCMVERGDASYVALQYVREFFGLDGGAPNGNASEFSFLCENLSRRSIKDPNPCVWVSQPWPVIVAHLNHSEELSKKLIEWLNGPRDRTIDNWRDYLVNIVLKSSSKAVKLDKPQSLKAYAGLQLMAPNEDPCGRTTRWCVSSDLEYHKCSWLARAVETHDISPRLECVKPVQPGAWGCLAALRDGKADIVGSDSTYSEIARRNFNLRPLLYQETSNENAYKILAVVNAISPLQKLSDLRQKTACFNEYGTIAMSSWLDLEQNRLRHCPTHADFVRTFPKACVPGADDDEHNPGKKAAAPLCVQCAAQPGLVPPGVNAHTCVANESNLYYGDLGALRCLEDHRAEVAFIDLRGIPEVNRTSAEYRVICRNGTINTTPGLNVDFNCSLSEGIGGEILTHRNVSTKSADALYLLNNMQLWFDEGLGRFGDDVVLNMFADGWGAHRTRGVLFRPSTLGFVNLHDTRSPQVRAFASLQESRKHCRPSSAASLAPSFIAVAVAILVTVLPFLNNQGRADRN